MDGKENLQRDTETVDKEDGNKSDGGCSYEEDGTTAAGDGTPQQKDEEMDCRTPAPPPPPPIIIPVSVAGSDGDSRCQRGTSGPCT